MDVKYANIINALTEINSELNVNISLEDIISIPENKNILKRELIYLGAEIADTFYVRIGDRFFQIFKKESAYNQIRLSLTSVFTSGDVFLNGLKISSSADQDLRFQEITNFVENLSIYKLPNYYTLDASLSFLDITEECLSDSFKKLADIATEANNILSEKDIPLKELAKEGIFSTLESNIISSILKDYTGSESIKRGISIFRDEVPGHFPISFGFPVYYTLTSNSSPDLGSLDFISIKSDLGLDEYLIRDMFHSLNFSKEKIKILKILGLKKLKEVCPKIISMESYATQLSRVAAY